MRLTQSEIIQILRFIQVAINIKSSINAFNIRSRFPEIHDIDKLINITTSQIIPTSRISRTGIVSSQCRMDISIKGFKLL